MTAIYEIKDPGPVEATEEARAKAIQYDLDRREYIMRQDRRWGQFGK
jgi:hypothetical protein